MPNAIDPAALVGWACSNQTTVSWVLGFLLAHTGFSVLSAILKKYGVTADSPWLKVIIPIIRGLAIDVKPPPEVIVHHAADIVRASPDVAAATNASPDRMDAAADAIKLQPKGS